MQELKPEAEQQQQQQLKCPRCESPNTKFCYYNNYNLSQPRHFCKDCRRYWTKGGALRNVPIGGSTRSKISKRPSSSKRPSPSPVSPDRHTISSILPPVDPDDWLLNFNDGFCSLLAPSATFGDLLDDSRSGGAVAESLPGSSGFGMELQQSSSDSNGNEGVLLLPETGDGCWPDLAIYSPGSSSK